MREASPCAPAATRARERGRCQVSTRTDAKSAAHCASKETNRMTRSARPIHILLLIAVTALAALGATVAAAAAEPEAHIRVTSLIPDHVKPGKYMLMYIAIHNDGDASMSGNVTVKYTFPEG